MKSAEKQIEQAERLQEAGLCRGVKEYIIELKDGSFEIYVGDLSDFVFDPERSKYENCKRVVGPIPTFEEVWPELKELLRDSGMYLELGPYLAFTDMSDKEMYIKSFELGDGLAHAAIEALLYLHEAKQ